MLIQNVLQKFWLFKLFYQTNMKIVVGRKRPLSAAEPMAKAGVMAANIPW